LRAAIQVGWAVEDLVRACLVLRAQFGAGLQVDAFGPDDVVSFMPACETQLGHEQVEARILRIGSGHEQESRNLRGIVHVDHDGCVQSAGEPHDVGPGNGRREIIDKTILELVIVLATPSWPGECWYVSVE
jgi:hypothetical protein